MRLLPRFPILVSGLVLATLVASPATAWAEDKAEPVAYEEAVRDLATLGGYLKDRKAINDQINQYLELVARAYVNLKRPDKPADDAGEDAKAAYKSVKAKFDKDAADFRKKAEKLFFKAFGLQRVKKDTNQRDDVNTRAAQVIAGLGKAYGMDKAGAKARAAISKKLRGAMEKLKKIKYDLNTDTLGAAFMALGQLGSIGSLEWMLDEYSHTKENEQDWLVAAHTAIVQFPTTQAKGTELGREWATGKLRFAVIESFIKSYASVESAANRSSADAKDRAKKRFWDNIKNVTIPVMQHFAGAPMDADSGEALATMNEFEKWFRKHKNVRKDPWADPK